MKKTCIECDKPKEEEEFPLRSAAEGTRQNRCKACQRAYSKKHYKKNKHRHNARRCKNRLDTAADNRRRLLLYLRDHPCVDCGEPDPVLLEFDHLRDKKHNISWLVPRGYAWTTILEEIAKCEVRCVGCHRRRTAKENGWYKLIEA